AYWVFYIFQSYLWPVFASILVYILARPFHRFLTRKIPRRPVLTATLSTLFCMVLVFTPIVYIVQALIFEAIEFSRGISSFFTDANILQFLLANPVLTDWLTDSDFWFVELFGEYIEAMRQYSGLFQFEN